MADLTKKLQDAAYITMGLGVIGFQKAQVRRQELRRRLKTQWGDTRRQMGTLATEMERRMEPVLGEVQGRMSQQAKELLHQVREAGSEAQERILARLGRGAA